MQKTFQKFIVLELVERIARFRLLLDESADPLRTQAPGLYGMLRGEAERLEEQLLSQKAQLNRLFSESGSKSTPVALDGLLDSIYNRLSELSKVLVHLNQFRLEPETHLFLKDAVSSVLTKDTGEQSVFLTGEGEETGLSPDLFSSMLIDTLSVLQKNNPLAWVGLTRAYARHQVGQAAALETLKQDLAGQGKRKAGVATENQIEALIGHALNLRLLGPAYYFYAVSEAVFRRDAGFLHFVEPALFFGLNHQNFAHKSLVILHEACERANPLDADSAEPLNEDTLAQLFRVVEKLIPAKAAFQEKHFERAVALQERLSQGTLLSSTPLFPVDEVSESLQSKLGQENFSIYDLLGMMTEYPHTPREIVNAGWLHKVERGPVWLYSALNEERGEGFDRMLEVLDYQDHLLRKSIEVSEVHRVLLCAT